MCEVTHQGRAPPVQGVAIDGCIVRRARLPTATEETHPFARAGPDGGLRCAARMALWLVVGACPAGMRRGFRRPFHDRVSPAGGTLEAPVHPGRVATAFRHGRDASGLLARIGRGVAVAWFAASDAETRGKDRTSAW
jgi:hypothetical protein